MDIATYNKKRDFTRTREPKGRKSRGSGNSFVIQKHDATRLHYDLRLEMDGVLKSWAVTRGPSLVAGEKRLAVHVEDHPLEYGGFEGTIPKKEYGGGTVIVWDRGTWKPEGDAKKGYAKGHLEFELTGEKLSGRWHLVRMAGKPREKRENWLLIKSDDEAARPADAPDILEERPESALTGRVIAEVEDEEPGWSSVTGRIDRPSGKRKSRPQAARTKPAAKGAARKAAPAIPGARAGALPDFVEPSLATLAKAPPSGEGWLHEIKFDGYRLIARIEDGKVKLFTRSGLDWTKRFGKPVLDALRALPARNAMLDGELVVETATGASDFSALQADLSEGRKDRFAFYLFDLIHLDGLDLRPAPLVERKRMLAELLPKADDVLRYSDHFGQDGDLVLRHACRLSLEGVVSKKADAPYRSGRTKGWIKSKCSARQEFVIAGYVPSTADAKAIGSLALGVFENGKLQPVGRVGTGFSVDVARDLFKRLKRIERKTSPFAERLPAAARRGLSFVAPEMVAEVEFRAWTADGNLRHAAFRGLREDKPAAEIVRETEASAMATAKRTVKLTHPDRVYWPDAGVTKEDLADYYAEVWRYIAPFIVGRPLALLRCPTGIEGQKFFQKHVWKGMNRNIVAIADPKKKGEEPMVGIDSLDGLMGLVQSAALEIHPWGAMTADLERPDTLVMDLDPGPGVEWPQIVAAAHDVRERLAEIGLNPFVKTTGGKGIHVVAPLQPKATWTQLKAFTRTLAMHMSADSPNRYVATITKSKRKGRILIDYLRNQRGATAVAPYSTRARPGAAVSMPLDWKELGDDIGPAHFTVDNAPKRLVALKADPWAEFRAAAVPLPAGGKGRKPAKRDN